MDESFGDLDEITRDKMNAELLNIWTKKPKTLIFITHNISEAVFLADRVAIMSRRPGRINTIVDIPFKRPRNLELKESKDFIEKVKCLKDKLLSA